MIKYCIYRDYIARGSEIHIDMYDDRLEIQLPGGMFEGKPIQDCNINTVSSVLRNPVIADLFHRMKFMERCGSGLRKIISETEKLPGYNKELHPEFHSSGTDFRVFLKNMNYNLVTGDQDSDQDGDQVNDHVFSVEAKRDLLIEFCEIPRTREDMMEYVTVASKRYFRENYIRPLLDARKLKMTILDKPNSKNQKYIKAD